MTFPEFSEIFAVLALQLREMHADEKTAQSYFRVLKDTDVELVRLAAGELARTAQWFPKSSEWLSETVNIEKRRTFQLSDTLRKMYREGRELCANCGDTGWQRDEHDHVSRCECQSLRRLEIIGRRPLPNLLS